MAKTKILMGILLAGCGPAFGAQEMSVSHVVDSCAANLDRFQSWRLNCEVRSQIRIGDRTGPNTVTHFDLRFDGTRICSRRWLWSDISEPNDQGPDRTEANYVRRLWDGHTYKTYYRTSKSDLGTVLLDDLATVTADEKEYEVRSLQYRHDTSSAMGYFPGSFDRIDTVLRDAQSLSLREDREEVNGVHCYVIDAQTRYGDFTVWIDPEHGFSIVRRQSEVSKAAGHLRYGKISGYEACKDTYEVVRLESLDDLWLPSEAIRRCRYRGGGTDYVENACVRITEFVRDPDHEASGSFEEDDVPNGTLVIIPPVTHIRYVWQDGDLVKHIDENLVRRMDATLATMMQTESTDDRPVTVEIVEEPVASLAVEDPNDSSETVRAAYPHLKQRAHCGLYCMYSLLRLAGRELDYRDLVEPEYYGRLLGSSMAELNQAAHDYGLHAGVAARLSTRALRRSPYPAILHVKAEPDAKEYDHYTLYLGTEKGKAKVFSPPEEPKLVDFAELAPLWDGYALFVSQRPFDIDTLFQPDRQRLYFCGMSAALLVLIIHVLRRFWLLLTPALSRRLTLGLTAGQAGTLALIALLGGGFYHFANDEGYLANPVGVAGVQKAHAGAFIPKISAKKARKLLGEDVVVIDARLTPDYERGHLEGAISLPIDANDATWDATIPKIPPGRSIVAYCQSAGCKFAEKISLKLRDEGFDDIVIFKGGWVEWEKKYGRPEAPRKEAKQDADHDPNV